MTRRTIAGWLGVVLGGAGLVVLGPASTPAMATGSAATMRQLAGAIPNPFSDTTAVGAMAKTGDSLFVVDLHGILRVDLETNQVSRFAGDPLLVGSADGPALSARFNSPDALATDGVNLYVLDRGNYTLRRIVISTGQVTTLAGAAGTSGYADGTGAAARFAVMGGMTLDSAGSNLYVADQGTIRKIVVATRAVTTLAGMAGQYGHVDGTGPAARVGFYVGAITEDAGALWMTDTTCIRKVLAASAQVTTLACPVVPGGFMHGITAIGTDVFAVKRFEQSDEEIVTDLVRVAKATGVVSPAPEPPVPFLSRHLLRDGGRFWISGVAREPIRTIDPATGIVSNPFGFGQPGTVDGAGPNARFFPTGFAGPGMATDGTNLYVSDEYGGSIRKVVTGTGVTTTLATGITRPRGSTVVGGDLLVGSENTVKKVVIATGQVSTLAVLGPSTAFVNDIASDGTNLYITSWDCAVYRVVIATGAATVFAGSPGQCGHVEGVGTSARFGVCCQQHGPKGIAIAGGSLYLADKSNDAIRKIVIATVSVTTAVNLTGPAGAPLDVVADGGDLYLSNQSRIHRVPLATGMPVLMTGTYPAITYRPAVASATRPYPGVFENALALGAHGHHLYFTNSTGIGVITDAKAPPHLTIGDVTMSEGNGGSAKAVFTVRLSSPQPDLVSVVYLTNDGTATTAGGDYVGQSGRLDFAPGVVEQRVKVTVNGDTADEANESFKVRLVWPSGRAVVARNLGTATVLDDDPAGGGATLALGDVSVVEGDDGGALVVFPVRLSSAQPAPISVNFATGDFNATAASGDYDARTGTLNFATGVTSATIFVKVNGDYDSEALEAFTLTLSGSSGPTITRAVGVGRIINDD